MGIAGGTGRLPWVLCKNNNKSSCQKHQKIICVVIYSDWQKTITIVEVSDTQTRPTRKYLPPVAWGNLNKPSSCHHLGLSDDWHWFQATLRPSSRSLTLLQTCHCCDGLRISFNYKKVRQKMACYPKMCTKFANSEIQLMQIVWILQV